LDREANGGLWRVGLSIDRGPLLPQRHGEVAVDERTGFLTARRF
jgi:hypothetical protein